MHKVLIINDDRDVAEYIKHGLILKNYEVKVAHTGYQGLEIAHCNLPDLVVLNSVLPDSHSIDICRELRAGGDVGIIILSENDLVGERIRCFEAGADDYVIKPFVIDELTARIRAIIRRCSISTNGIIRVDNMEIDIERRIVRRGNRLIDMTTREFELLKLLAKNAGKPLRHDFIMAHIWGYEFEGYTDPVKVYISLLRRKLNAGGEPDLLCSLRGYGYILKKEL